DGANKFRVQIKVNMNCHEQREGIVLLQFAQPLAGVSGKTAQEIPLQTREIRIVAVASYDIARAVIENIHVMCVVIQIGKPLLEQVAVQENMRPAKGVFQRGNAAETLI